MPIDAKVPRIAKIDDRGFIEGTFTEDVFARPTNYRSRRHIGGFFISNNDVYYYDTSNEFAIFEQVSIDDFPLALVQDRGHALLVCTKYVYLLGSNNMNEMFPQEVFSTSTARTPEGYTMYVMGRRREIPYFLDYNTAISVKKISKDKICITLLESGQTKKVLELSEDKSFPVGHKAKYPQCACIVKGKRWQLFVPNVRKIFRTIHEFSINSKQWSFYFDGGFLRIFRDDNTYAILGGGEQELEDAKEMRYRQAVIFSGDQNTPEIEYGQQTHIPPLNKRSEKSARK